MMTWVVSLEARALMGPKSPPKPDDPSPPVREPPDRPKRLPPEYPPKEPGEPVPKRPPTPEPPPKRATGSQAPERTCQAAL